MCVFSYTIVAFETSNTWPYRLEKKVAFSSDFLSISIKKRKVLLFLCASKSADTAKMEEKASLICLDTVVSCCVT